MVWQWYVNQGFAFIGLILVILSFQQKSTLKLIIIRNFATLSVFTGLCFLGNASAIIMCGAGVLRNAVALFFAIKPNLNHKQIYKYASSVVIVLLLIVLNIIFWNNWFNIYSMVLGAFNVYTFMQERASKIRICSVIAEILAITYFAILLSPTNIVIETVGLISAIVGIIRFDIHKKEAKL